MIQLLVIKLQIDVILLHLPEQQQVHVVLIHVLHMQKLIVVTISYLLIKLNTLFVLKIQVVYAKKQMLKLFQKIIVINYQHMSILGQLVLKIVHNVVAQQITLTIQIIQTIQINLIQIVNNY